MTTDFRWAARRLVRRPGFSLVFITILGTTLGIGLTVGMLADATLGSALPYADESSIVVLSESHREQGIEHMVGSLSALDDWNVRSRSLGSIGAVRTQLNMTLDLGAEGIRLSAAVVSRSMFDVLGTQPALGRPFNEDEDRYGAGIPSVILSHDLWRARFGSDPSVVGGTVELDGRQWSVIGVASESGSLAPHYASPVEVWLPLGVADQFMGPEVYTNRQYRMFQFIARVPSVQRLEAELPGMSAAFASDYPDTNTGWTWVAESLRERVLSGLEGPIKALFVGGMLLLAVAVVDLLALHLQKSRTEFGDVGTRLALGASAFDVARLSVAELALLGLLAGVAGVGISALAIPIIPRWLPLALPAHVNLSFDWRLAIAGVVISMVALITVGVIGTVLAVRGSSLSAGHRGAVGSRPGGSRVAKASLGLQIAMTAVLAIGAATAVRSLSELAGMDAGVQPDGLMTLRLDVPAETYDDERVEVMANETLRVLAEMPAVDDAFLWSPHVPSAATWFTRVRLQDRPDIPDAELPAVRINSVSAGAVGKIGLDIVAGRDLSEDDRVSGRRVVLVSESAARQWWGSSDAALGRSLRRWNREEWTEVVGVVADAALSGRQGDGSDFFTDVYFLFGQDLQRDLVFFARVAKGASVTASDLRGAVVGVQADIPPYDIRSMTARLREQEGLSRSTALLSSLYAGTAVVLAILGLYGAISFVIVSRRREIGLRQALGARPAVMVTELVRDRLGIVVGGLAAGGTAAWLILRPLASTLVGIGPRDLPTYGVALVVLLAASVGALLVPSVRAVRRTPVDCLRDA